MTKAREHERSAQTSAIEKRRSSKQDKSEVGYKKPPKEYQFKPGQSGNPKGSPVHRINLWPTFCKFMAMTDKEFEKLDRSKLTQAQQTAVKLVEDAKSGKCSGSERLARHVFDREEGKALQPQVLTVEEVPGTRELSDEELARLVKEPEIDCDDAIASL